VDYTFIKLLHLLCFVYWLGADIGVFYASRFVCNPALGMESRLTAARIMGWIDMFPRYSLVLILPLGLTLAVRGGWWPQGGLVIAFAWLGALVWLVLVWQIGRQPASPLLPVLRQVDYAIRVLVIIGMLSLGAAGLAGVGPLQTTWLAAKAALFGGLVACGLAVRMLGAPFRPAFARLQQEGSTPEIEALLQGAMRRAKRAVVAIWILLLAAAWLAIAQPA